MSLTKSRPNDPDRFDTISIKVRTTDGVMFCHFLEQNDECIKVLVEIGKNGTSIRAWTQTLMNMVNTSLDKGVTLSEIAVDLSNITTGSIAYSEDNTPIKSGPMGFVYAINKYFKSKNIHTKLPLEIPWR